MQPGRGRSGGKPRAAVRRRSGQTLPAPSLRAPSEHGSATPRRTAYASNMERVIGDDPGDSDDEFDFSP